MTQPTWIHLPFHLRYRCLLRYHSPSPYLPLNTITKPIIQSSQKLMPKPWNWFWKNWDSFPEFAVQNKCRNKKTWTSQYHTHIPTSNGPFSGTTQKGKTDLDSTETRDSEWQWHQLGHMQVCTALQTDNHTSTPPLSFL